MRDNDHHQLREIVIDIKFSIVFTFIVQPMKRKKFVNKTEPTSLFIVFLRLVACRFHGLSVTEK